MRELLLEFILLFMIVVVIPILLIQIFGIKKACEKSKIWVLAQVHMLCSGEWKKVGGEEYKDDWGKVTKYVLEIQSLDCRKRMTIPFHPTHPSFRELVELERYEMVRFERAVLSLDCVMDSEICAHVLLVQ